MRAHAHPTMNEVVFSGNAPRHFVPVELSGLRSETLSLTSDTVIPVISGSPTSASSLEPPDGVSTTETLGPDDDCSEVTVPDSPTHDDSTDRRCHFYTPARDRALSLREQPMEPDAGIQTSSVYDGDDELTQVEDHCWTHHWKNTLTTLWTKHRRSALTGVVIAVVWVLILLPALSYHIPGEIKTSTDSNNVPSNFSFVTANTSVPVCSEGFYLWEVNLDNSTAVKICRPECGKWAEFPHSTVVVMKGLRLTGSYLYILGGAILLAISVVLHHRMFKFPSVFVIYLIISVGILEVFSLVSHTWESLFCSSPDLLDSIDHPSPYCTITGVVQYYVNMQAQLIWIFHIFIIFWSVQFPLHRRIYVSYNHKIHLTIVLCVLLIPAVLAGIPFATGGYSPKRFPPDTCHAADPVTIYYVYMLPSAVVSVIGVSLLVIILRNIISHMQSNHRRGLRTTVKRPSVISLTVNVARQQHQREQLQIGTAEVKMTVVCLYFLFFALFIQIALAVGLRHEPTFTAELTDYFTCESTGQAPGKDCKRSFERLGKEIFETATYFILGFYPFVYLLHVVSIDELKARLRRLCGYESSQDHQPQRC